MFTACSVPVGIVREFGIFGLGIGYPLLLLPARFCLWIKPNASLVNVLDPLVHFPNLDCFTETIDRYQRQD